MNFKLKSIFKPNLLAFTSRGIGRGSDGRIMVFLAILGLSFSSGLPLALTSSTLQAWYTVSGVDLFTIGALSLVGQPYIYKVVWAPFLDRYIPFSLGRRRSWILLTQLGLVLGLVSMAFLKPESTPGILAMVALIVAFFSATQDIAFDAYRTDVLSVQERGIGASLNSIGYRLAMVVSSAMALILAAKMGWQVMYLLMAGLMLMAVFITLRAPNPPEVYQRPSSLGNAIMEPLKEFISRKNAIVILIFILTYKLCDAFALSLNTTFLIRGLGFSLVDVGTISKVVTVVASLLGALVGGILLPRMGLYRSLFYFGFMQMVANLSFALLGLIGKNYWMMGSAIFIENFCSGLTTVAFVVFLMSLCDQRYTATQYALLSAVMAMGRVFVGPEAAILVEHLGWVQFYILTFFIGIPALVLLYWLNKRKVDFSYASRGLA